jgi:hypothetical protein
VWSSESQASKGRKKSTRKGCIGGGCSSSCAAGCSLLNFVLKINLNKILQFSFFCLFRLFLNFLETNPNPNSLVSFFVKIFLRVSTLFIRFNPILRLITPIYVFGYLLRKITANYL